MNLIALLGGGKGKGGAPKDAPPDSEPADDDSPERVYAKTAFEAVKDDDEAGFVEAFTSAVEACVRKHNKDSEPDADDSEA